MSVRLCALDTVLMYCTGHIRLTFEEFINNFHVILQESGYHIIPALFSYVYLVSWCSYDMDGTDAACQT